ncbi:MAG: hypothetical protein LLG02_01210 [Pelosinus sp.]|nr:hypothetical protein [Pelosinus sp.]
MTKYYENGVFIYPSTLDTCHITYTGLLKQCGATAVYAHVGQGCQWKNTQDYQMEQTAQGFELSLPLPENVDRINLCFKDSAGNWDNNTGANYSFLISTSAENSSMEVAEEFSPWDNLKTQCQNNVTACKTALCRWFGTED